MNRILKFALLIFAMSFVAIGCRKDNDASLINTWKIEKMSLKQMTFNNQVDAFTQAMIKGYLEKYLEEEISPEMVGGIFDFRSNGEVFITSPDGEDTEIGTYTTDGNILSINDGDVVLSGRYTISKNTLYWDIGTEFLGFGNEFLETMGITNLTFRLTFTKK